MISAAPAFIDPREASGPRVAVAFAGSLALHAVVFALLMLAVGAGGRETGPAFAGTPLRARLVVPAAAPEPVGPAPPAEAAVRPASVAATAPAIVPLPLPPATRALPPAAVAEDDRNAVLPDDGAPVDPAVEAIVQQLHPGATRAVIEFDVPPAPRYPDAARAERRQQFLRVPAVVREDGSIAVVEGMLDDPLFGAAVHEALAGAKVRPAESGAGGRWTVLTFYFESYGSGESQRTRYEAR